MLCRLCLLDCDDLIDIFEDNGRELNISFVIKQHFGLELQFNDRISKKICTTCWLEIENFHVFYVDIQRAQEKLNEELQGMGCGGSAENEISSPSPLQDDMPRLEDFEFNFPALMDNFEQDLSNVSGDIDIFAAPSTTSRDDNLSACKRVSINYERSGPGVVFVDIETPEIGRIDGNVRNMSECTPIDFCTVDYNNYDDEILNTSFDSLPDVCKILQRDELSITPIPDFMESEEDKIRDDEKIKKYLELKCDQCGAHFDIFSQLKQHFRTIHKTSGYVVCCNQKLYKRVQLMEHIMRHINPEVFRLTDRLHNVSKVDKGFAKICRYCRRVFRNKKQYDTHIREHNANKPSKVQCKQCGLWFKSKHSLQKHIKFHVDQTNDFVCSLCGRKTISDIALHRHIRNVHYKERKYQCILCGKAFKWSINLKEHMAIHTGESLYKCPYCPKKFNASSNLHSHRKKLHRLEWEKERVRRRADEGQKGVDSQNAESN